MTRHGADDASTLARVAELLDRQDIYDCIKRVARGIDRFDEALFTASYHPDAVIDAGAFVDLAAPVYAGGAALHREGQSATLHHLTNHLCEIDGDTAHAETYFLFFGRNRDGSNWAAGGRYADRLERRDGSWKIAFRSTMLEWSGLIPTATVPLFEDVADAHLNGVAARDSSDPSYRRPLENRRPLRMAGNPEALGTPG